MADTTWERLRQALKEASTPEARKKAAEAFEQYNKAQLAKGKGSRPTLVNLGKGKSYPNAVPLDKVAEELEKNPEFYDLLKRIVK